MCCGGRAGTSRAGARAAGGSGISGGSVVVINPALPNISRSETTCGAAGALSALARLRRAARRVCGGCLRHCTARLYGRGRLRRRQRRRRPRAARRRLTRGGDRDGAARARRPPGGVWRLARQSSSLRPVRSPHSWPPGFSWCVYGGGEPAFLWRAGWRPPPFPCAHRPWRCLACRHSWLLLCPLLEVNRSSCGAQMRAAANTSQDPAGASDTARFR